jgi:DNA replication protein DnaC
VRLRAIDVSTGALADAGVLDAIRMEIIEGRHGKRSTLFTSQVPMSIWYEVIGEQTIADVILNRIVHDAHRLELQGDSLRTRREAITPEGTQQQR